MKFLERKNAYKISIKKWQRNPWKRTLNHTVCTVFIIVEPNNNPAKLFRHTNTHTHTTSKLFSIHHLPQCGKWFRKSFRIALSSNIVSCAKCDQYREKKPSKSPLFYSKKSRRDRGKHIYRNNSTCINLLKIRAARNLCHFCYTYQSLTHHRFVDADTSSAARFMRSPSPPPPPSRTGSIIRSSLP